MRYLIVGCGRVGSTLAKRLARAGHDITVVDESSAAFRRLGRDFGGKLVLGTGIDVDVLTRAGAERADGFATVTQGDNRNIMAAMIAQKHFNIKRVVARIYDPERSTMYRDFGISTICPTTVGARLMADSIMDQSYRSVASERSDVDVIEFDVDAARSGKTVADYTVAGKAQISIVVHEGRGIIPSLDTVLQTGDRVVAVVLPAYEPEFRKLIGSALAKAS
ncbi:MAG: TrkA family potassium uptake protein [Candidatus Eremiobacteraeota bacterium]|nr:TrkA family potassium uptake protein [Candidatus Eremiobacteraeota bacterium]MBC5828227.1 TrkA family potassium uptake protein [Candidatus Eremiobacteraeota bacterium]